MNDWLQLTFCSRPGSGNSKDGPLGRSPALPADSTLSFSLVLYHAVTLRKFFNFSDSISLRTRECSVKVHKPRGGVLKVIAKGTFSLSLLKFMVHRWVARSKSWVASLKKRKGGCSKSVNCHHLGYLKTWHALVIFSPYWWVYCGYSLETLWYKWRMDGWGISRPEL